MQGGVQGAIGGLGLLSRHTELGVESGQEVRQQDVGLLQRAGSRLSTHLPRNSASARKWASSAKNILALL